MGRDLADGHLLVSDESQNLASSRRGDGLEHGLHG
jgi:hypothetical protein